MLQCAFAVISFTQTVLSGKGVRSVFSHFTGMKTWTLWEMLPCHVSIMPVPSWTQGRRGRNLCGGRLVRPRYWPPCYYLPLHSEVSERESERRGQQTHDDKHIDAGSPSLPAQQFSLNPAAKHAVGLTVGTQSAKRHQKPSSAKYHYGL